MYDGDQTKELKAKTRECFEIINDKMKLEVTMTRVYDASDFYQYMIKTKSREVGNVVGRGEFRIWTLYEINPTTGRLDSIDGLVEPVGENWNYKREAIRSIIPVTPNPDHEDLLREYIAEQLRKARKNLVRDNQPQQAK